MTMTTTTDAAPQVRSFLTRRVLDEVKRLDAAGIYPSRVILAQLIRGYTPDQITKARWQILKDTGYQIRTPAPTAEEIRDEEEFCGGENPSPEDMAEVQARIAAERPNVEARLSRGEPIKFWAAAERHRYAKKHYGKKADVTRRDVTLLGKLTRVKFDGESPELVSRMVIRLDRYRRQGQRRPWSGQSAEEAAGSA